MRSPSSTIRRLVPSLVLAALLAACGGPAAGTAGGGVTGAVSPKGTVTASGRLAIQDRGGRSLLGADAGAPWVASDLDHVVLVLATQADPATPLFTIAVPRASLATTAVAFTNLDHDTAYAITAKAYHLPASGGVEAEGSEVDDGAAHPASCTTTFTTSNLADQDLGGIRVQLADKTFAGNGLGAGVTLTEGSITHAGAPGGAFVPPSFKTLAGGDGTTKNGFGYHDGSGTDVHFKGPSGLAVDADGDVYVADSLNNAIRRIDHSTHAVTTLAGGDGTTANGLGYHDGSGTDVHFSGPSGVAVDGDGNVYVADFGNCAIRRIDHTTHAVTTLAGGDGTTANGLGYHDGSGTSVHFSGPSGVAVDSDHNVYVADSSNHAIRMIDHATYAVTTLAGGDGTTANGIGYHDGSGTDVHFNSPNGLALDGDGNVYVADSYNHAIRRIDHATHAVTTLAGGDGTTANGSGYHDGSGTEVHFGGPNGVALDSHRNVYVAESLNNTVRVIDHATHAVTTFSGGNGTTSNGSGYHDGSGAAALYSVPVGVAVDASGAIYLVEFLNAVVRRFP